MSFAFEREGFGIYEDKVVKALIKKVTETDVLVVIGYSFPFVNRKVDREFLKRIPRRADELKICIQDPAHEEIKEKILSLNPELKAAKFEFKPITYFHVPFEV